MCIIAGAIHPPSRCRRRQEWKDYQDKQWWDWAAIEGTTMEEVDASSSANLLAAERMPVSSELTLLCKERLHSFEDLKLVKRVSTIQVWSHHAIISESFSSPLSLKTSLQMIHSILRNIYAGRSLTPTELWTVRNSTNAARSTMVDTIVCPSPLVLSPVSSISFP